MSMTEDTARGPGSRNWMRVLLAVSLALNLLFVGLAVGAAMRFGGMAAHHRMPSVGAALFRALPEADRRNLRVRSRELLDHEHERPPMAEAGEIVAALTAEPFDRLALEAIVARETQRRHAWITATQKAWVDQVAAMSAAGRREYAERLQEVMERRARWLGRRDRARD